MASVQVAPSETHHHHPHTLSSFSSSPLELLVFLLILSGFPPALSLSGWACRFCLRGGQKDGVIPLPASNVSSYNSVAVALTPYPEQDDGEE